MKNRKPVLLTVTAAVLCCAAALLVLYSHSGSAQEQLRLGPCIDIGNLAYAELEPSLVQKLHLSVDSCEGLTEVGKVTGTVAPEKDDRIKEDSFPEIAYAYPESGYPNLVVAPLNGIPTVFQFTVFVNHRAHTRELQQIYGSIPADKITVSKKGSDAEIAVTDPEAIAQFYAAFNALPGDDFADFHNITDFKYDATVSLANGFPFHLTYMPSQTNDKSYFTAASCSFYGSKELDDWFAAHVN